MSPTKVLLSWGKKVLVSWWRRHPSPICRQAPLRGEELESRCLPTTFLWDPIRNPGFLNGYSTNWDDPDNWLQANGRGGWESTDQVPGEDFPNRADRVNFQ